MNEPLSAFATAGNPFNGSAIVVDGRPAATETPSGPGHTHRERRCYDPFHQGSMLALPLRESDA